MIVRAPELGGKANARVIRRGPVRATVVTLDTNTKWRVPYSLLEMNN